MGPFPPPTVPDSLYSRLDASPASTAVSVILKLRGETCDIDCLYCYEKRKVAPGGARITPEQIKSLAQMFGSRPLAIELHGGEPLTLGMQALDAILRELAAQPSVVRVAMQTNGVQLNDAWLDLFDELMPDMELGLSLDGDEEGNRWRVGYDGAAVYPRVVQALHLLARRGRRVGVIAAVTTAALGRAPEILDHLASFPAVNAVSFVPCFDTAVRAMTASPARRLTPSRQLQDASIDQTTGPAWAVTPGSYAQFVLAAADHWVATGLHSRFKLEPAVSTIRRIRGLDTQFCHFSGLKCDHVFTLYPDGRLGSCDELPWPAAGLTNLNTLPTQADVVTAQHRSRTLGSGLAIMSKCVTCSYRDTCGGGCIATRLRFNGPDGDDDYCAYRMRLVDGIASLLAAPHDRSGVWCEQLRWRPRQPNIMPNIERFLLNWDHPPASRPAARLATSKFGNVNTVGLPGVQEADDLDPGHPQWRSAIEPGAWDVVDALTARLGFVTYDSCQGHDYRELGTTPATWRVGMLPRNTAEYTAIAGILCRTVSALKDDLPPAVHLAASRADLHCEATARRVPVLELSLVPGNPADWDSYFAALGTSTRLLADRISNDRTRLPCACSQAAAEGNVGAKP